MSNTKLDAYVFFPGNTQEAMGFYKSVFGGELAITTRGDVDPSASGDEKSQVINASLSGGEINLRASDRTDATLASQNRVALSIIGSDEEKLRKVYDDLSAGGSADHPLEKVFWGDTFGGLTDKYGINWQVNIEAKKE
jgi:PhnB protein